MNGENLLEQLAVSRREVEVLRAQLDEAGAAHEAVAQHVWRIRQAANMVLAGIDWKYPEGVMASVPINRLADLKATVDQWDADMMIDVAAEVADGS